jgi:hypothetical protein
MAMDENGNAVTDEVPAVRISTARASVRRGKAKLALACVNRSPFSACRGTVSLVIRLRHRLVVLARSRYALASGGRRVIILRIGHRSLLSLRRHPSRVRAVATLNGGPNASRSVSLRL